MNFDHDETLAEARSRNVRDALYEDIGRRDWTGELIPADRRVHAAVRVRESGVLCGQDWFCATVHELDPEARIQWQYGEGATMSADTEVCRIEGNARALLSAERPALNFLQLLSGTATLTRRHVDAIEGAATSPRGCAVLDTRKTLPGLRQAQKYAVRVGGGSNHRLGLFDAVMLKENHIHAAGSIAAAAGLARERFPQLPLIIEVENLDELDQALRTGCTRILIDDFSLADMREAVRRAAGTIPLEVSGGVDLHRVREIARTGVDCISVGALTKHVQAIDFSMRLGDA
jgi:nicotinate-nucleotide pyrophosphorylase (carboxylating)